MEDGSIGIKRNIAVAVLLKYISNFVGSPEMQLINCKIELKLMLTMYCVLASNGSENADANSNNVTFTIKGKTLYVPVVILSAKDEQKVSKLIKGFKRSVYWNDYKTKTENKNKTNEEYGYFLESNFRGVNRLFILIYSIKDNNSKRYKAKQYYIPKGVIKNYNVIINPLVMI